MTSISAVRSEYKVKSRVQRFASEMRLSCLASRFISAAIAVYSTSFFFW